MNLGEAWRSRLDEIAAAEEAAQAVAQEAIEKMPGLITQATDKGEKSINIPFRLVQHRDVTCGNVESLWKMHHDKSLTHDHLVGAARIVLDWCSANGLECFLKSEKVPKGDFMYSLCARPK